MYSRQILSKYMYVFENNAFRMVDLRNVYRFLEKNVTAQWYI